MKRCCHNFTHTSEATHLWSSASSSETIVSFSGSAIKRFHTSRPNCNTTSSFTHILMCGSLLLYSYHTSDQQPRRIISHPLLPICMLFTLICQVLVPTNSIQQYKHMKFPHFFHSFVNQTPESFRMHLITHLFQSASNNTQQLNQHLSFIYTWIITVHHKCFTYLLTYLVNSIIRHTMAISRPLHGRPVLAKHLGQELKDCIEAPFYFSQ